MSTFEQPDTIKLILLSATASEVYVFAQSRQQQANGGIGWSDDGIAKYNKIYDLVEVDRQLRGKAFNQELLKVHQKRRQKNKPPNKPTMDNERLKKRKPRDDLRKSQEFKQRRHEMTPLSCCTRY